MPDGMTGRTTTERLLEAIGYPERTPRGTSPVTLRVDGAEVAVEEADGRLVLSCALAEGDALLPALAGYAAGRMLKESATLAYGEVPGHAPQSSTAAFLWQDAPLDADGRELLRLFETFMDSCDWWRARVDALRGEAAEEPAAPELVTIRP